MEGGEKMRSSLKLTYSTKSGIHRVINAGWPLINTALLGGIDEKKIPR